NITYQSLEINSDFETNFFIYFLGSIIFIFLNLFFTFDDVIKKVKDNRILNTILLLVTIGFYVFSITVSKGHVISSLSFPKFIEKPQDSSWYLIHNGNTTSENINGLSKRDILAQKDIFNAYNCTGLKNEESKKKCQDDNKDIFNNRDNALYGYMAWNLGSTKVFCPVSVDFFKFATDEEGRINQSKDIAKTKTKIQQEKSAKCLVIDDKYLQPVSEHYLAK
ncbi:MULTISPECIES: hypothetical protein, partial [unclassified Moraxella]